MGAEFTLSLPDDLVETVALRVAEILAAEPLARRYLDADEAAEYTGIQAKTLRTRSWREGIGIPFIQLDNGRLLFDKLDLDRWLASQATSNRRGSASQPVGELGWEPV